MFNIIYWYVQHTLVISRRIILFSCKRSLVGTRVSYAKRFIYFNSLNEADKERLEHIQYNSARLVTGALPCTSRVTLYEELGWETIQQRADFLGLTLYHKIHLGQTRPLVRSNMQPREYTNTRSSGDYKLFKYKKIKL